MDLRTEKVYDSLTTAFEELLAEKTFEEITVSELCRRARTRRATFYNHFADKYDFFQFMMKRLRQDLFDRAELEAINSTKEYLHACIDVLLRFVEEHRKLALALKDSPLAEQILFSMTSQSLAEYEELFSLDDQLSVLFLTGGINRCCQWWLANLNAVTADEMRQSLYELVDKVAEQIEA